jgi:hypothetical protein
MRSRSLLEQNFHGQNGRRCLKCDGKNDSPRKSQVLESRCERFALNSHTTNHLISLNYFYIETIIYFPLYSIIR